VIVPYDTGIRNIHVGQSNSQYAGVTILTLGALESLSAAFRPTKHLRDTEHYK
jgi:hypothetical protein